MSISRDTLRTTQIDTVSTSINYIRVANLIFVDRDRLDDELVVCKEINSLNVNLNSFSDSIIKGLELKVVNLETIISTKDDIIFIERDKYKEANKKYKKDKTVIIGIGAILITIAAIL